MSLTKSTFRAAGGGRLTGATDAAAAVGESGSAAARKPMGVGDSVPSTIIAVKRYLSRSFILEWFIMPALGQRVHGISFLTREPNRPFGPINKTAQFACHWAEKLPF